MGVCSGGSGAPLRDQEYHVDARQTRNFELAQIRYEGTMRTFARSCVHRLPGYDVEDVEQELLVVLWNCVMKYDPDKGAGFNSLFQGCAKNKVISLIRHMETKGRKGTVVYLEQDDVNLAVQQMYTEGSAEDWFLAIDAWSEQMVSEVVKGRAAS